jgi:hypothetical protein
MYNPFLYIFATNPHQKSGIDWRRRTEEIWVFIGKKILLVDDEGQ